MIRPYGFALWEKVRNYLDEKFRALGVENCYFPIFIPESFLNKEKEHISGFKAQCAWVEKAGEEELTERLAIRPTSEAIICSMFAKWLSSWRDLPLVVNQWVPVVRWEKTTRLFLRTTEFLWQEGHTLHRQEREAEDFALRILAIYHQLFTDLLAIPVIYGEKPESEKFAGAKKTYTLEALMPDGQALQAGTSHNLGQNFSLAFGIKYQDSDNKEKYPYGTSWGVSTRLIGALIMTHGDEKGLILPPNCAPIKVVIIPILTKEKKKNEILKKKGEEILEKLTRENIPAYLDARGEYSPGWKFNQWEMKGVPLRVEIGEREIKEGTLTIKRRNAGEKREERKMENFLKTCSALLQEIQDEIYLKAKDFLNAHITEVKTLSEFKEKLTQGGFYKISWCGKKSCEEKIKEETKTSPRVIPIDEEEKKSTCPICQESTKRVVYYARAY